MRGGSLTSPTSLGADIQWYVVIQVLLSIAEGGTDFGKLLTSTLKPFLIRIQRNTVLKTFTLTIEINVIRSRISNILRKILFLPSVQRGTVRLQHCGCINICLWCSKGGDRLFNWLRIWDVAAWIHDLNNVCSHLRTYFASMVSSCECFGVTSNDPDLSLTCLNRSTLFSVSPRCLNTVFEVQHFNIQLMHTTLKMYCY